ncbi:tetratricopeptide repeat-containing sensor histidine kinase [Flavobacterium taihuense]|uniref:histidine kinase n=1 Tax=Flavobacterium taihuense TaxID=2857508 RepID=A0ABS6XVS8_9FLAO|nr:tetratricopeptide repeat-containing sensor histidine kinase [Flavobacterium taihuense]MBW4359958.1 tetratricopeptide repeat-containing sensor histidine kinase [Flavobacterium taihuense]
MPNQSTAFQKKINYTKGIALSYNNFGVYYKLKSDFPKALKYNYKSLHIYESLYDKSGIAKTNNGLGTIYVEFKNYKLALSCYNKALKSSQEINDKKSIATYLNNIGDVYLRAKVFAKALYYFDKAIKMNVFEKNSYEAGLNYTNIGITLNRLKEYKKSIKFCTKSALIYNNDSSIFNAYNKLELGISHYYLAIAEQNKIKKNQLLQQSLDYTNEALKIFEREESLIDIRDTYSYLSKIYKAYEKTEQALAFFEKSSNLNDSIFSNENKIQIEFLKSQREIELRNKKIEIQNLKIKSDSAKVYLLYTIISTVIILLSLFLWLYLSKRKINLKLKKKNKIISNINKQKDKFFSIIAHDLRGPFNGFLGLTELLAEDIDDMDKEEIQFAAINMRNSAKNLNLLLENLLEWSRMEQGLIPFSPQKINLTEAVKQCTATLQDAANKKNILIETNIDKNISVFADYHILQSVIRNILSNALKFTPKNGTVKIQARENQKNTVISIIDSGVGMDTKMVKNIFQLDAKNNRIGTDGEPSTGLGLILCKEFVVKHGGKIWLESEVNKGSIFYFNFPHAIT